MLRVIYESNKMKYKRKLYLSKKLRVREKTHAYVCTLQYVLSRDSLTMIYGTSTSSSLVVKVEKATHFKNSFQLREATNHRVIC